MSSVGFTMVDLASQAIDLAYFLLKQPLRRSVVHSRRATEPKKRCPLPTYTPIGICSAERVMARGAVSSFQVDSALLTAANGFRLTSLPRPGRG
jgi:hypothetical protein